MPKRKELTDEELGIGKGLYRGFHPQRKYVPSFVTDNPFLDQRGYLQSLFDLDPVTREQYLRGDWGVSSAGRFRKGWIRYFSTRGDHVCLGLDGRGKVFHIRQCRIFITVDPAASVREGPGDPQIWAKKSPSWTVISTWVVTPQHDLLWWDLERFREEIPDIFPKITAAYKRHQPEYIGIEASGLGIGVYQTVAWSGLPVRSLSPRSQDKLVRATDAANRMERGKIFLPQHTPMEHMLGGDWLDDCQNELFTWTGHPHEAADQIDTLSYAAMEVSRESAFGESETLSHDLPGVGNSSPLVFTGPSMTPSSYHRPGGSRIILP